MLKTRTANLLDIVELVEDLPEYGVTRGEQGVVVEVFDEPNEGYILEFVDPSGTSSRLAYWVKPEQIKRVTPRKAQELEVVEAAEDLPEYGVKKGERAVVTTAFSEPDEAYDLEFVDESGTSSRVAYSVKPNQIRTEEEVAKEAFERGVSLLNAENVGGAEVEFRKALEIRPDRIEDLHNRLVSSFGQASDFRTFIDAMRFVLRLNPLYTTARSNLAIAYENLGVECAKSDNLKGAIDNFITALGVDAPSEIVSGIQRNLATAYTTLGVQALESDVHKAVALFGLACAVQPSETTRHNHAAAHAHLAWFYLERRGFREAIYTYKKVIDMGLCSRDVLNNYGVALAEAGEADEATRVFEELLRFDPQDQIAEANFRSLCQARERGESVANLDTEEVAAQFAPIPGMHAQEYRASA
jgi:tetratricopeptide (TPR) repeat protein